MTINSVRARPPPLFPLLLYFSGHTFSLSLGLSLEIRLGFEGFLLVVQFTCIIAVIWSTKNESTKCVAGFGHVDSENALRIAKLLAQGAKEQQRSCTGLTINLFRSLVKHNVSIGARFSFSSSELTENETIYNCERLFSSSLPPRPKTHAIMPQYFFIFHSLKRERISKKGCIRLSHFMLSKIQHLFSHFLAEIISNLVGKVIKSSVSSSVR